MQSPPTVMAIGGHDPSGGAGIQADALTLHHLGCHPVTVITAVTVQDTVRVLDYQPLDAGWVRAQAEALIGDMQIAAIKTGMLAEQPIVEAVADIAARLPDVPLVLDPVLSSNAGQSLAGGRLAEAIRDHLLPAATLATPNIDECRVLGGASDVRLAVESMLDRGCRWVLVTGTHDRDTADVKHTLYGPDRAPRSRSYPRLSGEFHGSGCTLAAAAAAYIARGEPPDGAADRALDYTWRTLDRAYAAGTGQLIPQRSVPDED